MAELDDPNKSQIKRLFLFLRQKRERIVKELSDTCEDVKQDRCSEQIYNQGDVGTNPVVPTWL